MSEEMKFFLFLIERYADKYGRSTGDVLREWDEHHITDVIFADYFQYHQERLENAFDDINSLVSTGTHLMYEEN